MTTFFPESTPVLGNLSVKAVVAIADMAAPKLATEINAASSVDLSCFLRPFSATPTTGSGAAPLRICTTTTLPQEGRTEFSAFELHYVYDPQGDDADADNAAKALLTRGTVLYLVIRKGLDAMNTAYAATQKVEVWKVRLGRQNRGQSGDGDQDEFEIVQMAFPVAEPEEDGVIAA